MDSFTGASVLQASGYFFHSDGHEHYPRNGTTEKGAYIYNDYHQLG